MWFFVCIQAEITEGNQLIVTDVEPESQAVEDGIKETWRIKSVMLKGKSTWRLVKKANINDVYEYIKNDNANDEIIKIKFHKVKITINQFFCR